MVRKREQWLRSGYQDTTGLVNHVREAARPLEIAQDLDPLMERIGDARYVLLGEASHGTAEYYTWRALLSRRLILEKGFSFLAVEGDWPDCYRVNRYVRGFADAGDSAKEVLSGFERWPTWMWANEEIVNLAEWMREHNDALPENERVGFYGLDVYSLWDSLYSVLGHLRKHDPSLLATARRAFQCFEPYGEDVQDYARATMWAPASCEKAVVALLTEIRKSSPRDCNNDQEGHFNAEQNALIVKNAEHYYRTMVRGGSDSWNVRDRHMTETLDRLMNHLGPRAKAIVWEHNTHIGDARFTDMVDEGMVNVGQLVREKHEAEGVVLVGFGSHHGSVIAADAWEDPRQRMPVPPAEEGSWESILHEAGARNQLFVFDSKTPDPFWKMRGHRAIGVVYHPSYERFGNYVPTVLPRRYDAFLYLDETEALHPLPVPVHEEAEVPETYPTGV